MLQAIRFVGQKSLGLVQQLGEVTAFAAAIVRATLTRPLRFRLFVTEVYKLGVLSLVIVCVSGLTVGMVLGLQGYNTLVRFGGEESLGTVVGLSLIRELGPVLTALLVTGRAGSATTAEIGTMVATEQLDGLRMMSVNPIDYVVQPKAWAMTFVMPLLAALFIVCGLFGGYFVGAGLMGIDPGTYSANMENSISFTNDVAGSCLKSLVFGLLVGLISTFRGYRCAPTSAGVSIATTSTVVTASVTVLLSDFIITALWGVGI